MILFAHETLLKICQKLLGNLPGVILSRPANFSMIDIDENITIYKYKALFRVFVSQSILSQFCKSAIRIYNNRKIKRIKLF